MAYVIKTKKEKHKERKHRPFKPTYRLIAKIYTTKVELSTLDFIYKNRS